MKYHGKASTIHDSNKYTSHNTLKKCRLLFADVTFRLNTRRLNRENLLVKCMHK